MTEADGFYKKVINEVVDKMRKVFIEQGQSEDILERLRDEWLQNLVAIKEESRPRSQLPIPPVNAYYPPPNMQMIPHGFYGDQFYPHPQYTMNPHLAPMAHMGHPQLALHNNSSFTHHNSSAFTSIKREEMAKANQQTMKRRKLD